MCAFRFLRVPETGYILASILIVTVGCQAPVASKGPLYKLRGDSFPQATTPIAVTISDRRPATDCKYQPGSVDLVDYEHAIDVLTLDNFEPDPLALLEKAVAGRLSELPVPPTWAEVDVTRFRVTVNRTEITAAEYERQRHMSDSERIVEQRRLDREYHRALADHKQAKKAAKQAGLAPPPPPCPPPPYLPHSAAPGVGVGVGLATSQGGGAAGIVGGIAAGLIAAAVVSDLEDQGPAILRVSSSDTPSGVTCHIEMHVRLHFPDNRHKEFDIAADAYSPPPDRMDGGPENPLMALQLSVIPTVQQAIEQASQKIRNSAREMSAGNGS